MATNNQKITIEPLRTTSTGSRYRVTFEGEELIASTRDPEHEACRALLARGITGKLETSWAGSTTPSMRIDIERGAGLTTSDGNVGPRLVKWQPMSVSLQAVGDDVEAA